VPKKSPTDVRPFTWTDLESSEEVPAHPGGGPARPYRWEDLSADGAAAPGSPGLPPADPVAAAAAASRREAAELLAKAREEAERLKAAARREGLEAGRAEGRKALEQAAEALRSTAQELAGYKDGLYREAREQVVELSLALVNRILGPLAEGDEGAVIRVVERALQLLSDRERLTLRVNPQDLRSLVEAKPQILEAFDGIQKLIVLEDPAVKRGGCLVQTPASEIDARLDTQLTELARSLRSS